MSKHRIEATNGWSYFIFYLLLQDLQTKWSEVVNLVPKRDAMLEDEITRQHSILSLLYHTPSLGVAGSRVTCPDFERKHEHAMGTGNVKFFWGQARNIVPTELFAKPKKVRF